MGSEEKAERKHLFCPYCDEEIMRADFPYCQACQITVFYCPQCHQSVPRHKKFCPHCGAEVKGRKD